VPTLPCDWLLHRNNTLSGSTRGAARSADRQALRARRTARSAGSRGDHADHNGAFDQQFQNDWFVLIRHPYGRRKSPLANLRTLRIQVRKGGDEQTAGYGGHFWQVGGGLVHGISRLSECVFR
jgi:hypothetical protein